MRIVCWKNDRVDAMGQISSAKQGERPKRPALGDREGLWGCTSFWNANDRLLPILSDCVSFGTEAV